MIEYLHTVDSIADSDLEGFFEGWPNPPSACRHLAILQGSDFVVVAKLENSSQIVGFITAISDGVSCAYIPHLEVLQPFRGQGIGKQLVKRMLHKLDHHYMVDLVCDPHLRSYYEKLGLSSCTAMIKRNYARQACQA